MVVVVVVVAVVVVVVVVVVVAVECMPDPAADVGSCCESDGENFFTEENVDRTWSEAAQVVETPTVELDEDHFTSSSSDSDAESVVLEAPVNFFCFLCCGRYRSETRSRHWDKQANELKNSA